MFHSKKVIEDFTCGKCGAFVVGTGRTDHCPKCLWSRHMDNVPGDRAAECGGAMKPIGVEVKKGEIKRVLHKCETCGHVHPAPVASEDDRELLIKISVAEI